MTLLATDRYLRIGRAIRVRLRHVGRERQPLLVVDDMLDDADAMIEAARAARFYVPPHTNYPGLNANLPEAYYRTVLATLRGALEAAFGLPASAGLNFFGYFGLAATGADEAAPVQKIPHHDGPEPGRLAMVHYLGRGAFGGTGFFRHKATGFESVDGDRQGSYVACAQAELEAGSARTAYAGAGMEHYDLIDQADWAFNRLVVYRGHVLHSALLGAGPGATDPAAGRLTANGFIEAAPPR
ncbi:MAG: hypothetical protein J7521_01280 [Caulobacter sp.]|nr:hypothetical protein [Caulobacter sp.]